MDTSDIDMINAHSEPFEGESQDPAYLKWKEEKIRETLRKKEFGEMKYFTIEDVEAALDAR
jgi:hypothetical protein